MYKIEINVLVLISLRSLANFVPIKIIKFLLVKAKISEKIKADCKIIEFDI